MDEKAAIKALRQVKEILDAHGIEFWLDNGTLLGAVRNGKFIPWDHDIDLGLWKPSEEKIKPVIDSIIQNGFTVHFLKTDTFYLFSANKNNCPINFVLYKKFSSDCKTSWNLPLTVWGKIIHSIRWMLTVRNDIHYDTYNIVKLLTKAIVSIPQNYRKKICNLLYTIEKKFGSKYIKIIVPKRYFTNLSTITFYGMEFKVPSPVEEYLEYRYGKDWRTPKREYIYYEEDGAIQKN